MAFDLLQILLFTIVTESGFWPVALVTFFVFLPSVVAIIYVARNEVGAAKRVLPFAFIIFPVVGPLLYFLMVYLQKNG